MSALPNRRYCRGCKCMVSETCFKDHGTQYKQCDRCRGRVHDRERSRKTVMCGCGKEVLTTSLRDHLRTLFHEQYLAEKAAADRKARQDTVDKKVVSAPANLVKPTSVQPKFKVKVQPVDTPRTPINVSKAPADAPKPSISGARPPSSAPRLPKPASSPTSVSPACQPSNVAKEQRYASPTRFLAPREK